MIQSILVGLLFLGALIYVGRRLFVNNHGSDEACESCAASKMADMPKIKARQTSSDS